jgi:hypothetical protein
MNRFFSLPQHILSYIYEFDDTYRRVFDLCCSSVWAASYDVFMRHLLSQMTFKPEVLKDANHGLQKLFDRIRCDKLYAYKPTFDMLMVLVIYKDPDNPLPREGDHVHWNGTRCVLRSDYRFDQRLEIFIGISTSVHHLLRSEYWTKSYEPR